MACKPSCQLCKNLVISQSITLVTVDGTDTLVVDLPTRAYNNNCKICVILSQTIPNVPINTPVAFSIGGNTETVYPFVRCDCSQITVCAIRTRTRYSTIVSTNAIGGVFKSLGGLKCCPSNNLLSLPVPATTGGAVAPANFSLRTTTPTETTTIKVTKTPKKEVTENA